MGKLKVYRYELAPEVEAVGLGVYLRKHGALLIAERRRLPAGSLGLLVVALILLDLSSFGRPLVPRSPVAVLQTPFSSGVMKAEPPFRTAVLQRQQPVARLGALLSANLGLLWGAEDVLIPSPLRMLRNERYVDALGVGMDLLEPEERLERLHQHRPLLDLSGVRYLFTTQQPDLPDLVLKRKGADGVRVYENVRALPRAFLVPCTREMSGEQAAWQALLQLDDPRSLALVEGAGLSICREGETGSLELEQTSPSQMRIQADLEGPAWLVIGQTFYPGQQVRVDGQMVQVVRTDYLFSGIPLAAGRHEVTWSYTPRRILSALWVALGVGLGGLLMLLALCWPVLVVGVTGRRQPGG